MLFSKVYWPLLAVYFTQASASCAYGTILQPREEGGAVKVNTFGYIGMKVYTPPLVHILFRHPRVMACVCQTIKCKRLMDYMCAFRVQPTGWLSTREQILSAQTGRVNPPSTWCPAPSA